MAANLETIHELRRLLADRFGAFTPGAERNFVTGLDLLDEIGVPQAALTEIVSTVSSGPGGALLLYGLLHAAIQSGQNVVLIDGKRAFAPKGLPASDLRRLLWTRCGNAWEVIKAADLAIRDGNVPLVILLLTINPAGELNKIPANAWHRLQMLGEKSSVTTLVFSPHAMVGCARLRIAVGGAFPIEKLHGMREELLPSLSLRVERRKVAAERRWNDEELRRPACA
jgi:hypothetical protein